MRSGKASVAVVCTRHVYGACATFAGRVTGSWWSPRWRWVAVWLCHEEQWSVAGGTTRKAQNVPAVSEKGEITISPFYARPVRIPEEPTYRGISPVPGFARLLCFADPTARGRYHHLSGR